MDVQARSEGYFREFLRSRSGVAGLVMLVLLVSASLFVVFAIPPSENNRWRNPSVWSTNPQAAPPVWVNYFGVDAPQTETPSFDVWKGSTVGGTAAYSASASFSWVHGVVPSNVVLTPSFNGTAYEVVLIWTKPDGNSLQVTLSSPSSGASFDLNTPSIKQALVQYLQSQTGMYFASMSPRQELAALFNNAGPSILNNTVEQGTYALTVQILGGNGMTPGYTKVSIVGDSYGTMGTDSEGRPIGLGVLVGLPWALELGAVASILSVVGGVLWGGLSGFYGGWRDKVMSWWTLVFLAIPGLAFIIALSYTIQLTLLTEAVIIASLSWPAFAIIARSVTLSIRSQTYIEADRAMGISSTRAFFTHIVPRLTPVAIAFTALSISGVIILAETLAFLGIEPGNTITWGGILNGAITFDASVHGWWWWTLFPGIMIVVASLPFVLLGFAIDRMVAPRVNAK